MRRELSLAAAVLAAACKSRDAGGLVVGIQSEPMGGIVSSLHVVIRVAGAIVHDETVSPPRGSKVGFPQPWEKRLLAGSMPANARVEVDVDVMGDSPAPLFTRRAATQWIPGATTLLRVPLESRCVIYPVVPRGNSTVPGPLSGPTCTAPFTCIQGTCQPSAVAPASLEPYVAGWPTSAPDRCKPLRGGAPALQVGTGQTYYLPLTPMQTMRAEAGPQGGHHIWIATRMKNLKQAGSTTKVSGVQPGTGVTIPPTTLAFTYAPDEGEYCRLTGIRYQLDNEGIDYKQFLGKPLDVIVTVTEPSGLSATETVHVHIAPTLVNP